MKFALCNEVFEKDSWPETVKAIADAGYDGVEIAPFTLADSVEDIAHAERRAIHTQAQDVGLDIAGLHWLFVSPKGLHTTTDDDATRRRTTAYMQSLIRFCGDLGGKVMVIGSPKQRDVQPGVDYAVAWQRFVDMIAACLDMAVARKVTLCMEALPAGQTNFVTTLDEAVRMVREVNHPNFQSMFDVHNACLESEPLPELVRRHISYIRHVHVNEMDGTYPGNRDFDFGSILRVLREERFQGYVSAEVFDYAPRAAFIAEATLGHLQAALRDEI